MKAFIWQGMMVLFGMALILTLGSATLYGSSYEKDGGKEYEQYERYEHEFYGTIENLPEGLIGIWTVSGMKVEVTKDTYVDEKYGKVTVGAYVEVKGKKEGRIFKAYKIEIKKRKQ